jgi:hypothetical protein
VRPELSKYAQDFPQQYKELWRILKTDQIIWCGTDGDWPMKGGYEEWSLEVPESALLTIVDEMIWNEILGKKFFSKRLFDQLEAEASKTLCNCEQIAQFAMTRMESSCQTIGERWTRLFIDDPFDPRASVLLKCPIESQWVVETKTY